MNESDYGRLAEMADALARLERRQEEILRRLERLERVQAAPAEPALEPFRAHEIEESVEPPAPAAIETAPPPQPPPPEYAPPPMEPPEPRGFETRMGLTWVNRIGVVTLVFGAAFFFKYAVESGWIGVWTRLSIGAASGFAALLFAERVRRTGQTVYAQGLAAAGVSILYLTVYAAYGLYQVLPQAPAFLLMVAVTVGAVWLSLQHVSAALAGLGLAGAFATPLLLGAGQAVWFVLGYALLLDGAAVYLSRERAWRSLEVLALVGTMWLYGARVSGVADQRGTVTVFLAAFWTLAAVFGSRWLAMAAQFFVALALATVWNKDYAAYFGTALALAAGGLWAADRRAMWPLVPQAAFWLAGWAASWVWPAGPVFWFLTAAFVLFFGWLPWRVLVRGETARSQDLVMLAANAGIYFALACARLYPGYAEWRGPLGVVLAAVHMGLAWRLWSRDTRAALLSAGAAWALLVLAAPAQFNGYRVTQVWVLEAAALAWIGTRLAQPRAYQASMAVFAMALVRLLFLDTWMYPSAWDYTLLANARLLTFLVAAACFWAASWWARNQWPAAPAYLAGHFVALWGLSLEVLGWAARTSTENVQNAGSTGISILWAAYALGLVGAGVSTGTALNRALGLGLIGVVVAKLYLYDVWSLGLFYRMAAFAALGVLLLVMSYLYSRRQRPAG